LILADENISQFIIQHLREKGFSVLSVYEDFGGLSDKAIIEKSQSTGDIILTEDKDFGEWSFAHKHPDMSVILLRYSFEEIYEITNALVQIIIEKGLGLKGKFPALTVKKVRIREL